MSPFTSQENHLRFELPPLENDVGVRVALGTELSGVTLATMQ
jgi:hypothetical protein